MINQDHQDDRNEHKKQEHNGRTALFALHTRVAQTLSRGDAKMTLCDVRAVSATAQAMLNSLNPSVAGGAWHSMLDMLASEVEGRVFETFPDALLLALVTFVGANGRPGFRSLSFSLEELEEPLRDRQRQSATLSLIFVHTLEEDKQHWLSQAMESLRHVLQWVGGTLHVPLFSDRSLVAVSISLPCAVRTSDGVLSDAVQHVQQTAASSSVSQSNSVMDKWEREISLTNTACESECGSPGALSHSTHLSSFAQHNTVFSQNKIRFVLRNAVSWLRSLVGVSRGVAPI